MGRHAIPVDPGDCFEAWTVLEVLPMVPQGRQVRVRCVCGVEAVRALHDLRRRITKSCGCRGLQRLRELAAARKKEINAQHPLYDTWRQYRKERGFFAIWETDFNRFVRDVQAEIGPRPRGYVLVRRDPEGRFEPGNLAWCEPVAWRQSNSNVHWITVGDERLPVSTWARRLGTQPQTITNRLRLGWDPALAVTTPVGRRGVTLRDRRPISEAARQRMRDAQRRRQERVREAAGVR